LNNRWGVHDLKDNQEVKTEVHTKKVSAVFRPQNAQQPKAGREENKREEVKSVAEKRNDNGRPTAPRADQGNRERNSNRERGGNSTGNRERSGNRQGNRDGNCEARGGYQGNRDGNREGRNSYQGNRDGNREGRSSYQGNRDGRSSYQGNREGRSSYQGNRDGNREARGGYQGSRDRNAGNRNGNPGNRDGRGGNYSRGYQGGFDKDKDAAPSRNFQSKNNSSKPSTANLDGALAKKTSTTRLNKNNFKNQRNDKKHRTEDGPAKGGRVSRHPFIMPVKPKVEAVEEDIKEIIIPETITIKDLASKMKLQPSAIVKKLFLKGEVMTLNSEISFEKAEEIALEYDVICTLEKKVDVIAELLKEDEENAEDLVPRPPVVCVMGHVDHGKTSLLDAIRKTNVTSSEAGGITQHIGAYMVQIKGQKITFLDTPGHEAFTAMRMRGAKSTDIAILVVAADDGVMPQTVEAINHAKAAGVEIIVAVNKIDKPGANVKRVKQELSEYQLIPEDWGGSTIFCEVSAKEGRGIENLLEMILLTAEVKELKANPNRKARGIVIEAELDRGRGSVATILVQKGTLHVGDFVAAGACSGKVRAMINDQGRRVEEATPSTPVEILGLDNVPNAGEVLVATEDNNEAKAFAATFISEGKNKLIEETKAKLSLDDLFSQIKAGNVKELPIILKADVQGSVEAVKQSLIKISNEEVQVKVIHDGVGAVTESDVALAAASNAIIIGFNVRADAMAKTTAEHEKVDLRFYKVIYQVIADVESAMKGMLEPIYEEKIIGHAEIRQLFKASGIGTIAGSYVLDGKFQRGCKCRITRDGEQIFDGNLASLKRFKDDVKEVAAGYECGLVFEKFNDVKELDQVEAYAMVEVPRS